MEYRGCVVGWVCCLVWEPLDVLEFFVVLKGVLVSVAYDVGMCSRC